jgi:putative sigma-54 modulation protein
LFQKTDNEPKIRITSRHEILSEAIRSDIETKIQRVNRYLSGDFREAHIILNYEKKSHVCEATLSGPALKLAAKALSHDMYQSIEACFAKLMRQAAKAKDKRVHQSKGGRSLSTVRHGLIPAPDAGGEVEVVRSRKHAVKPMSVEEAALQLSSSKDEFLVFFNAESGRTNVVYKRRDQHIGLIEPEY